MRFTFPMKSAIAAAACAFAVIVAAGCSSGGSGSNAGSAGASSEPAATSAAVQGAPAAGGTSPAVQGAPAAGTSAEVEKPGGTAQGGAPEGQQVFEGTVHVGTAEDIIKLQGIDIDPAAAGGGGTYAVLAFDSETNVTGQSADGTGERTEPAKMLGIAEFTDYGSFVVEYGDLELCKQLDGQHVTLAASTGSIMFPTDVRLPIGEPSAKEVTFL